MAKNGKMAFSPSPSSTYPPLTIEGMVSAIASDPTVPPAHIASIKMAAADLILCAGTGLIPADCVLAVSARHVMSKISDLISCESVDEHLQAIRLLQRYALTLGCRPPLRALTEKMVSLHGFVYHKARRRTLLVNPPTSRALTAYVAWSRQPLFRPVGTK